MRARSLYDGLGPERLLELAQEALEKIEDQALGFVDLGAGRGVRERAEDKGHFAIGLGGRVDAGHDLRPLFRSVDVGYGNFPIVGRGLELREQAMADSLGGNGCAV